MFASSVASVARPRSGSYVSSIRKATTASDAIRGRSGAEESRVHAAERMGDDDVWPALPRPVQRRAQVRSGIAAGVEAAARAPADARPVPCAHARELGHAILHQHPARRSTGETILQEHCGAPRSATVEVHRPPVDVDQAATRVVRRDCRSSGRRTPGASQASSPPSRRTSSPTPSTRPRATAASTSATRSPLPRWSASAGTRCICHAHTVAGSALAPAHATRSGVPQREARPSGPRLRIV